MVYSTNKQGDCYCSLWEKDPQFLRKEGVPKGYCGFCDSIVGGKECGKPGHIRHYPGSYPVTACWCDEHYEAAASGINPVRLGCMLVAALLLLLVGWLVSKCLF